MDCVNCGSQIGERYKDPKTPPIEVGKCLCASCWEAHAEEVIEDLQEQIQNIINCSITNKIPLD